MNNQCLNPYLPSYEYIPDGEPYVFGERLYVFGSHDRFNGKLFFMNDYVCWSASIHNLSDWRYEGVIYRKNQDPMNKSGLWQMYAPDVAKGADGRYYLYYTLAFRSVMAVAVCDTPAGKYEFYGYVSRPDGSIFWNKSGDPILFDPAVLVDVDGSVYLYSGFAPRRGVPFFLTGWKKRTCKGGYVIELEPDMKTVISEPKLLFHKAGQAEGTGFEGHEFFEASSIRKINHTYYFIYSSINGHELCYATSKSPTSGFVYGGTIVSNGDLYINGHSTDQTAYNYIGNNHGSIVEVNNRWYVFHHRQTNRHHYSRQGLAEPLEIKADGSIPQVEMTSCGLNNGPLHGKGEYEARIACHLRSAKGAGRYGVYFGNIFYRKHPYFTQCGKDREAAPSQYIANMRDEAVAGYKYFMINNLSEIAVCVRGSASGWMFLSASMDSKPFGKIQINPSKQFTYYHTKVNMENGKQALYFTYKGTGKLDFQSFVLS
ncbi:Glycosyl hydrolases family 43 [Evansella caseinilytica]|uniref:Glycosyl hydrolases family 43 n=1 Tax=Evansella caseinilytica TaxID=1503961 RepID=A0A1H3GBU5_9BACI|nr:family 43 glycosylhydrolase [Evansella caseinilytica]SDY00537.1 Glycosyl hydrolases family 43 [Evansella caseinilytica]